MSILWRVFLCIPLLWYSQLNQLTVRSIRGDLVETTHQVAVAIVDREGTLTAFSGDPELITPMRSAAKPFQALPLVEDGVIERFEMDTRELALACASHNSESYQVAIVRDWMARLELTEGELVCGPHRPLAKELGFFRADATWEEVELAVPSRMASNCSGKHTGMLAVAMSHDWTRNGYEQLEHPVQQRCLAILSEWCGIATDQVGATVDGCGVISWAVPLRAIAAGYARIAADTGPMRDIVSAMTTHPELVAGTRRLCTGVMQHYPGGILAKVGAGGVYAAALLDRCLGIAIKVLDGDSRAAAVALMAVLEQMGVTPNPSETLARFATPVILNTNKAIVGHLESHGSLSFCV